MGGSTRLPRLCHAVDLAPAKYVALSHCWGGHVPLTTTQGTLAARQCGIELDSLPKTFRDAIMVTRALDLQYIWIDSLCIIQDSRQDWNDQAPQMHRIYDNAVLTIAADGAVNGTVGLSSPERALYRSHLVWGSDEDGSAIYASRQAGGWNPYMTTPAHQLAPFNQGPLSKRAWTLQERMLSRRTLHFDVNEMAWSCQTMTACECTTEPQMWPGSFFATEYSPMAQLRTQSWYFTGAQDRTQLAKHWNFIVSTYTGRDITFVADKLPALAGIATRAANAWGATYLAGMWKEQLEAQLLWYSSTKSGDRGTTHTRPGEGYYAPSWSWASTTGPIHYRLGLEESIPGELLAIRRAECIYSEGHEFLSPESGLLEVEGLLGNILWRDGGWYLKFFESGCDEKYSITFDADRRDTVPCQDMEDVKLLVVAKGRRSFADAEGGDPGDLHGLVLTTTGGRDGMYRRVGIVSVRFRDEAMKKVFMERLSKQIVSIM